MDAESFFYPNTMGSAGIDVLNTHNGDYPGIESPNFQSLAPVDDAFINKAWPGAVDTTNYGIKDGSFAEFAPKGETVAAA